MSGAVRSHSSSRDSAKGSFHDEERTDDSTPVIILDDLDMRLSTLESRMNESPNDQHLASSVTLAQEAPKPNGRWLADHHVTVLGLGSLFLFLVLKIYAVAGYSITTSLALVTAAPGTVLLGSLMFYLYLLLAILAVSSVVRDLLERNYRRASRDPQGFSAPFDRRGIDALPPRQTRRVPRIEPRLGHWST
jgi:hypothetical protein